MGKSKKDKRNRKDDDFEDEVATEIAALSLENKDKNGDEETAVVDKPKKKEKKKKSKKAADSDEEEDEEEDFVMVPQPAKKSKKPTGMSAFQMLDMLDDGDLAPSEEEEEEIKPKETKQKKKSPSPTNDDDEKEDTPPPMKAQQKKGKKGKKVKQEEEDIDAILAAIEEPTAKSKKGKKNKKGKGEDVEAVPETEVAPEAGVEGDGGEKDAGADGEKDAEVEGGKKKKEKKKDTVDLSEIQEAETVTEIGEDEFEDRRKKKKGKKGKEVEKKEEEMEGVKEGGDEDDDDGGEEDGVGAVKTKAQKKKEKKERQKKQKLEEKPKGKGKKDEEKVETKKESTPEDEATPEMEDKEADKDEGEKGSDDEDGAESKSSKKKKERDRKKKKDKKEEDDKKKKPVNKQIKAMQEALARVKEEEERLIREEQEKEKRIEEARLAREEQARLEAERKERIKQKKKEREARLKAEGKFLTKKQKEDRQRALQMLEQMKAQGIEVPGRDAAEGEEPKKKRVVYEHKKKRKPGQKESSPSEDTTPVETPVEEKPTPTFEAPKEEEPKTEDPKEEEPMETWEEAEIKEDWAASDEEKEEKGKTEVGKTEKEKEDEDEESEEDSEEEEEESKEDGEGEEEEEESSEESDEESSSSESDDGMTPAERAREKALARMQKRKEENEKNRSTDVLRAPVVCVLGHVDTGKTKILDKLRRTHVQDGEAGGITQQIGATNVPLEAIREQTKMCKEFAKTDLKVPGLLIIDTPGHESFSNLRSRGSSLCDIAVLVVDIMHGLEPQTIESINLLKQRKTPFVVALNKVDRLYQWKTNPHNDIANTLKKQSKNTRDEFDDRLKNIVVEFAQQNLNVILFHENKNPREWVSMVPTSAHTGDGMGNLMALICELTQAMLAKRLSYTNELQATVMEVKALPGLGTTIDVILVNGTLRESDTIVLAGQEGPITTQIRGLLVPPPMKELRVKNSYEKVKELKAAQGVKIIAKDIDKALAGLPLYVAQHPDETDIYREDIGRQLKNILNSIKLSGTGVYVQASTLGSLEALLEFLRTSKIPYSGINIGPVHKRDVMKASVMVEHDLQYAVILAFDVKVERDAQELADSVGVQIFTADIIYHLFDRFTAYREEFKKRRKDEFKNVAVFPCKLRILPQYIFNSRDPIVVGVSVEAGFIKCGTPLCVPAKDGKEEVFIGRITSIENNHKESEEARRGSEVCIKIEARGGEAPKMYGRHFDSDDILISKISRESIDAVKDYFRDDMQKNDWQLIVELKKLFKII